MNCTTSCLYISSLGLNWCGTNLSGLTRQPAPANEGCAAPRNTVEPALHKKAYQQIQDTVVILKGKTVCLGLYCNCHDRRNKQIVGRFYDQAKLGSWMIDEASCMAGITTTGKPQPRMEPARLQHPSHPGSSHYHAAVQLAGPL